MPQIDFNAVLKDLEKGLVALATTSAKEFANDAKTDGLKMLSSLQNDLQTWTVELANGDLTPKNLEYLVKAKADLIEMASLKHAGLAAIRIDQFKNSSITLILNTITGLIKV